MNVWQVVGALYLFYIAVSHLLKRYVFKDNAGEKMQKESGFWQTVLKVELADIAFAVDSILAAVALAVTLREQSFLPSAADGGQFLVILAGGVIGLIIMRFAASMFVSLLKTSETAAFVIVGWVGVKLSFT